MRNATERARDRFRWGVTEAKPTPTDADIAAHLYDVSFRWPPTGTTLSFPVLAIDEVNAFALACLRMDLDHRSRSGAVQSARRRSLETSGEAMAHALNLEYADEHACRQEAWRARQGVAS